MSGIYPYCLALACLAVAWLALLSLLHPRTFLLGGGVSGASPTLCDASHVLAWLWLG